jgi:hypothetical protein
MGISRRSRRSGDHSGALLFGLIAYLKFPSIIGGGNLGSSTITSFSRYQRPNSKSGKILDLSELKWLVTKTTVAARPVELQIALSPQSQTPMTSQRQFKSTGPGSAAGRRERLRFGCRIYVNLGRREWQSNAASSCASAGKSSSRRSNNVSLLLFHCIGNHSTVPSANQLYSCDTEELLRPGQREG